MLSSSFWSSFSNLVFVETSKTAAQPSCLFGKMSRGLSAILNPSRSGLRIRGWLIDKKRARGIGSIKSE